VTRASDGDTTKNQTKWRSKLPRIERGCEGVRQHRGDFLSAANRKRVMSRIRGKNTAPERKVAEILTDLGLSPELHVRDLPGRPDFVLRDAQLAVFVDGDFWHGWRFSQWRLKLSEAWERKIAATRERDARNHRRLRQSGWTVLRIWEHQIMSDPGRVRGRIVAALAVSNER
jgi:DNA mismatch endonuclease, patch repair protein